MVILWLKIALGMAFLSLKKSENVTQELKIDEVIKNLHFLQKSSKNDQLWNILTKLVAERTFHFHQKSKKMES